MHRLIDITLCLGIGGKPFRGHNEKEGDAHRGLFLDLVRLLTKYDPILKEHFDSGPRNALYHSNRIQNDIIASINTVLKNKLNIKNCPVEQFVCMKRLLSTDAQSIFNTLCEVIEQYEIQWQSVSSVCFDGAAAMSGGLNGVQAKFKEKNDKTVFVHCYGHCLNLVLVDSLGRQNRVTFDFFGTIQLIYNFIESSCTRHATLEKVANSANIKLKTLKSVSNTRWACRAKAVSAVKSDYGPILIAIQEIGDATKQPDVRAKALGLIHQMKTFDFIFAQQMLHPILTLILKVSMALQSSNLDLITAVSLIKSLKLSLKSMRNDKYSFTNIYNKTLEICEENNISIPDVKKRRVSSKIDYVMISSISDRFKQETLELIKSVGNMLKLETNNEDTIIIASAFNLDFHGLESEIILLKKLENIP
ncbi:protein FAM200B-like [Melanaphis sacchari]|uniref:protein FAM200B-like n=1 Tax=Melanaphis sacchari TaxID=742174 RepID=UPI000DC13A00|nr:protein FAM200B-like [Melanaphis sacchari]